MARWPTAVRWRATDFAATINGRLLVVWTDDGGKTWWASAPQPERGHRTRRAAQRAAEKWARKRVAYAA